MRKQYKTVAEIAEDLYAMLSYFKNDSSGNFNREANLIEKVRHSLNIKEASFAKKMGIPVPTHTPDLEEIPEAKTTICPRCGRRFLPIDSKHCRDCTIELAVYGEEDGSDA